MCASEAEKDLMYYTFKKDHVTEGIKKFIEVMSTKQATIGQIFSIYVEYIKNYDKSNNQTVLDLIIENFK